MSEPSLAAVTAMAGQGGAGAMLAAGGHPLVHLNAALNLAATVLLVWGHREIKRGREAVHGRLMLAALGASAAFLVSYLAYHALAGSVRFTYPGPIRYVYYAVLGSHVVLAFTVPFFAIAAAALGIRALGLRALGGRGKGEPAPEDSSSFRRRHRRVVRWAYPIWLYVSVTGVIVYAMLYHLWPSTDI